MRQRKLGGVIAAIPTPLDGAGAPDGDRFVALARFLLANGCDGLNVLGTTGEATSFSAEQRAGLMRVAAEHLPLDRMMVGTGAAALADAVRLTTLAAELGFAGALVLPPFYYKGVAAAGIERYLAALVAATAGAALPIYLYNYPALSGVAYDVPLVGNLVAAFGTRIAGLKDSSGDVAYARALAEAHPQLAVFPSNEALLGEARNGPFAGCISATANLNSALCARAFYDGDDAALATAVAIRRLFEGRPLVAGVKALAAHVHGDPRLAAVLPPLTPWADDARAALAAAYDQIVGAEPT